MYTEAAGWDSAWANGCNKAVYRTYRKVKAACVFLFVFFGMLTVCGDLSPGPMTVAAIFWVMLTCIFYYERKRLRNAAWEKD